MKERFMEMMKNLIEMAISLDYILGEDVASKYKRWLEQAKTGEVEREFSVFLQNIAYSYLPKEKEYSNYLFEIAKGGVL